MSDFADFVLGCWPAVVEVIAVLAVALAIIQAARLALWLATRPRRPRLRDLMDDGDGQGGIPPASWGPRDGIGGTRPMDLGDLVIGREAERHAAHLASRPTEVIDPDPALGCTWCQPGTLRAWPCQCAADCGDPACAPAVRHG